jgi:hypothetical protein
MAENDSKPNPGAASSGDPFSSARAFSLIICGLRDLAGMELPGIELRPELPRAVPVTMRRDEGIYLVGLRFETAAEAENFAKGLEEHCDRDGQRLLFKRSWQATTQDGQAIWPS